MSGPNARSFSSSRARWYPCFEHDLERCYGAPLIGTYTGDPPSGLTVGGASSGRCWSDREVCGGVVSVVSVRDGC